ncbi:MAG: four helix bundle protein [Terriglobales bacterium]
MADAYKDLIAWRKATHLALEIYRCTRTFPKDELYGLTSQMRRAAVSVASNIAEGKGRYSRKEFVQFLYRARGSLLELQTQLFIAGELDYLESISARRIRDKADELGRILNGLTTSVQNSSAMPS